MDEADDDQLDVVQRVVQRGQLEMVNGGSRGNGLPHLHAHSLKHTPFRITPDVLLYR